MSKVKKAQQNLTLPIDVIDNLRNLSSYRKSRDVEPAAMADIVSLCLNRYFAENKQELNEANFFVAKNNGFGKEIILNDVIEELPPDVVENLSKLLETGAKLVFLSDVNSHNIKELSKILTTDEIERIFAAVHQTALKKSIANRRNDNW